MKVLLEEIMLKLQILVMMILRFYDKNGDYIFCTTTHEGYIAISDEII